MPFVPEIRVHKADPTSGLRRLADQDEHFGSPYWAHYWSGGLVLARYILDHPDRMAGKRVLDLGTGSGLVAIAAALAGAGEVVAADVDPYAIAAATLNARANGVAVTTCFGDLTSAELLPAFDIVTVGDLFYDRQTAERVHAFLRRCADGGADILVGDPGRAHLPLGHLERIAAYQVSESTGSANRSDKPAMVFRLKR